METESSDRSERRKRIFRQGLRALNGAALGAPIGGLLGFLLGGVSAVIVSSLQGTFDPTGNVWPSLGLSAFYGIFPGVPGGCLIGSTIIIRAERKRRRTAAGIGLLTGVAYAGLWFDAFRHQLPILAAIVLSGLMGGISMAGVLSVLRRRWPWWTRWDTNTLHARTGQTPGILRNP